MTEVDQLRQQAERWERGNERYLSAAMRWLRLRLQRVVSGDEWKDGEALAAAEAELSQAVEVEPPPAAVLLSRRFGLSPFELEVLLLCCGMELDTRIPGLCAQAMGDPRGAHPSFALAMTLFEQPAWEVLSPERPLRHFRLVELSQTVGQPLMLSPLRVDERVLNYLKGLNHLDERLMPLLATVEQGPPPLPLPRSQQQAADAVTTALRLCAGRPGPALVQLVGPDAASARLVAQHAARSAGLHLYRLPAEALPQAPEELDTLCRLWERESLLVPVLLFVDAHGGQAPSADGRTGAGTPVGLARLLTRNQSAMLACCREPLRGSAAGMHTVVEVGKPTAGEQRALWSQLLDQGQGDSAAQLAAQFDLDLDSIGQVVAACPREPQATPAQRHGRLWRGCLALTRPRLDGLAQRIEAVATFEDLVLPPDELQALRQIATHVSQRSRVYEDWGFRKRLNRGLGISALFSGESGTGKTMAAEVVANALQLELYRIDLASVVSKYIGETEKNLAQLFDAAEGGGVILLFDEADALFGKRSEVKDSRDRYANIEINYLLQRIEGYRGLAILATNMKGALDTAFMRRLRFVLNFPFPGPQERKRLWERAWPAETPRGELDFGRLARLRLAGGSITSVALNAAFMAADEGQPVSMRHTLLWARREYQKLERPINERDFLWGPGSNGAAGTQANGGVLV